MGYEGGKSWTVRLYKFDFCVYHPTIWAKSSMLYVYALWCCRQKSKFEWFNKITEDMHSMGVMLTLKTVECSLGKVTPFSDC